MVLAAFDPPKLEPVIALSGMRARGMVLRTVPIGDAPPTREPLPLLRVLMCVLRNL